MAQKPNKASGRLVSNIIGALRGNFDFKQDPKSTGPLAYGSAELISTKERSKILAGVFRVTDSIQHAPASAGSLMNLVQTSLTKVGHDRLENRKILQLMPEVDKAARLMIASVFSPNDLTRQEIAVTYDSKDVSESYKDRLEKFTTSFFQDKLNLKTQGPKWVYQFGYETGAAVFAIIPLRSFEAIEPDAFMGTEAYVNEVIEPMAHESLFGFGDTSVHKKDMSSDITALESFTAKVMASVEEEPLKKSNVAAAANGKFTRDLIEKMIGQEALNLTDNPSVLQANSASKQKRAKKTTEALHRRYRNATAETAIALPSERAPNGKGGVIGNPILMRLPPESVTVIHTPGDPSDHQGYLVLLDHTGSPINALAQENLNGITRIGGTNNSQDNGVIGQAYAAYGLSQGYRGATNEDAMGRIYNEVVTEHIRKRLGKAGFNQMELGNLDSTFRCMFSRFLQQKQTRILFLPKDLVTYMTYEMDQNGYGISRLDGIKFNLGMKMAVQVSRVMAGIKSAMDRRKIEVSFTENMMENPEAVFQNIIQQYTNKSVMAFSTDPNVIQTQIADKSISIKGNNIPGMETFDLTNEPDNRTGVVDFDPSILEYLDKQILNGLHVPASTMNSLNEDEYARSVTTTNLFFSMDVSVDQDIVIKLISDLLRKYARYSEEFQNGLYAIFPSLKKEGKKTGKGTSSTDDTSGKTDDAKDDEEDTLPDHYTLDTLIDEMSISLPKPSVAPSKAQFESLEAMSTAIATLMTALFPDEMAGNNDALRPVIAMLRAKFTATNIRAYLDGSGMAGLDVPLTNFAPDLKEIGEFQDAVMNVGAMMEAKAKINAPKEPTDDLTPGAGNTGGIPGYQ